MTQKKLYKENDRKSVLVVGNGPSVANIDYRRLPKDIDIWRINDFFFEKEYYVGRKVDAYFTHAIIVEREYINMNLLKKKREYDINFNNFWTNAFHWTFPAELKPMADEFDEFLDDTDPEYARLTMYYSHYFQYIRPNTGISVLFVAAGLGHENIYVAGMDLHIGKKLHPWVINKNNPYFAKIFSALLRKYHPDVLNPFESENEQKESLWHPFFLQLEFINLLLKRPNINLYSIAKESVLNQYVPLAPIIEDDVKSWAGYVPEKKTEGATVDWPEFPQFDEPLLAETAH